MPALPAVVAPTAMESMIELSRLMVASMASDEGIIPGCRLCELLRFVRLRRANTPLHLISASDVPLAACETRGRLLDAGKRSARERAPCGFEVGPGIALRHAPRHVAHALEDRRRRRLE